MTTPIRTPDEAFWAGYYAPCEHDTDITQCETCRLRPEEIADLAVLLGPGLRSAPECAPQTAEAA